jgi:hypothetical protein
VKAGYPCAAATSDPAKAGPARILQLTIVKVRGFAGGIWSGSKGMTIRADLMQGAKVVASKAFARDTGGGMLGKFKGTCDLFERIADTLGRDVAKWLPGAIKMAPDLVPAPAEPQKADSPAPASAEAPKTEGQAPAIPEKPAGETKQ